MKYKENTKSHFEQIKNRFLKFFICLLLFSFSGLALAVPYYLFTPITGANTTFDQTHSSVWILNVSSGFDFGGGTFTIKQGGRASQDPYLILRSGSTPAANCSISGAVAYATISRSTVSGQYTPTAINFSSPVALTPGTYSVTLCSTTGTNGVSQFFIKGAKDAFVGDATRTPNPDVSVSPELPNFTLSKSATSTTTSGGDLTYTIGIGNNGTADSGTAVTISEQLPVGVSATAVTAGTGVSSVSCTNLNFSGALLTCSVTLNSGMAAGAANGTAAFTINATAPSAAGTITNYASVDGGGGNAPPIPGASCTPASNCASASTTVTAAPRIVISKSAPSSVVVDSTFSYTVNIGNSGSASYGTSGSTITVKDQLPPGIKANSVSAGAGLSSVSCGSLPSSTGALLTCTLTLNSTLSAGAALGAKSFTINALASASTGLATNYVSVDPTGSTSPVTPSSSCNASYCGSASTEFIASSNVSLTLTKTASVSRIAANSSFSYTLSFVNNGSSNLSKTTTTVLKDQLPNGVIFDSCVQGENSNILTADMACSVDGNNLLTITINNYRNNGIRSGGGDIGYVVVNVTAPANAGKITNYASIDPSGGANPPNPGLSCAPSTACANAVVEVGSIITMSKSVSVGSVNTNGALTYTIGLGNSGGSTSGTSATVIDQLPAGVVATSAIKGAGVSALSCAPLNTAGALLTCSVTLSSGLSAGAANGTAAFTINAIAPSVAGNITNYASVDPTGSVLPPDLGPGCSPSASCGSAQTTVNVGVNYTLSKTATTPVAPSGTIRYNLNIGNSGTGASASNASLKISEKLPTGVVATAVTPGIGVGSVDCGSLPSSAGVTLSCTVTLSSSLPAGAANGSAYFTLTATAPASSGAITNYASIDASGGVSPPTPGVSCTSSNCASALSNVTNSYNFTLSKTATASVAALGQITYRLNIGNSGGSSSGTSLTVYDQLPDGVTGPTASTGTGVSAVNCTTNSGGVTGLLSCDVTLSSALPAGAGNGTAYFTVTAYAPNRVGPVTNYASVDPVGGSSPPTPGPSCSPSASCGNATTTVGASLTLSKAATSSVATNGTITYTLNLGNAGTSASGTTATVMDQLPAGVAATAADIATGVSSVSCIPLNTAGALLTCSVSLTSALPAGSSNGTAAFTLTATAPATVGQITNYASVDPSGGGSPPTPGLTCTPSASCGSALTSVGSNFTLAKTATASVATGGTITYTIGLGNSGSATSGTSVTVSEQLPAGVIATAVTRSTNVATVNCGTLPSAPGEKLTCTVTLTAGMATNSPDGTSSFTITATAPSSAGSITNYASVDPAGTANPPIPGPSCLSSSCGSATTSVGTNFTLSKEATSSVAKTGAISYTLNLGNSGTSTTGTSATVSDQLPSGVSVTGATASTGVSSVSCSPLNSPGALLTCSVTLSVGLISGASNGAAKFTLTATAPNASGIITNYAAVDPSGSNSPPTPGANCSPSSSCGSANTTVDPAILNISKTAPSSLLAGSTASYSVVVSNVGGLATTGTVTFVDTLPSGLTFNAQTAGSSSLSCSASGQTVTCTGTPNIAATSGSVTVSYTVNVDSSASGTKVNTVHLTALGGDTRSPSSSGLNTPTAGNSTQSTDKLYASSAQTVSIPATFSISKTATDSVLYGGSITYTITVTNTGTIASGATATISELLPTGIVSPIATQGTGNTVNCGSLAAGANTCTLTFDAGSLAGGASSSFTISASAPNSGSSMTNYASVGATTGASTPTAGSSCTPVARCASAETLLSAPSSVSGTVTKQAGRGNTIAVSGLTVSLLDGSGNVVATTTTDSNGNYLFSNVATGNYSISFPTPAGSRGVRAGGNTPSSNSVSSIPVTVASGSTTVNQDAIVLDPQGVVYDAVTRQPVAGAIVTLYRDGVAVSNACLDTALGTNNGATTGSNGVYTLVLNACSANSGIHAYTLVVTPPSKYKYQSTLITPSSGPYVPLYGGGTEYIQAQATAPSLAEPSTSYYLSFTFDVGATLAATSNGVANNHIPLDPVPQLEVAKSFPTALNAGGTATYTLTLTNSGLAATIGTVTLTDTLPSGLTFNAQTAGNPSLVCSASGQTLTCTGTPNIAASGTLTVSYTVNVAYNANGVLINSVQYTALGGDPRTPSNSGLSAPSAGTSTQSTDKLMAKSAQTVPVGTLSIVKTLYSAAGSTSVSGYQAKTGDVLIYKIAVTETGGTAGAVTTLTETVPANTSYTGSSQGWSTDGNFTQSVSVAAGTTEEKFFTVTVGSLTDGVTGISNTVTASLGTCTTCTVLSPTVPRLAVAKTGSATLTIGGTATYSLVLTNNGGSVTSGTVTLADTLPTGLTFNAQTAGSPMACTVSGQTLTCTGTPNIAAGASLTVSYTVNVTSGATGVLINGVEYTALGGDPRSTTGQTATTPTSGSSTQGSDKLSAKAAGMAAGASSDFLLAKSVDNSSTSAGGAINYTLTIRQNGSATSGTSATISELIPNGVVITSVTGVSGITGSPACGTLPFTGDGSTPMTCSMTLSAGLSGASSASIKLSGTAPLTAGSITNYASIDPSGGTSPANPGPTCSGVCASTTSSISSGVATLTLDKIASAKNVELGDSVMYTLTLRHVAGGAQSGVAITDTLPLGFRYIPNTVKVIRAGSSTAVSSGDASVGVMGIGPTLNFTIGNMANGDVNTITYRVRVGVGAAQGTGINKASARSASGVSSNEATATVKVDNGVFAQEGCIIGKVYLDCNGNGLQDRDNGNEPGVGGVRIYTEDGTYMISDPRGSYSLCGVSAMTHVLKLDQTTLPSGATLGISANRNAGDPDSIFVDMKFGELHRADFIINNCSPALLEQLDNPALKQGTLPPNNKRPSKTKVFSSKEQNESSQNTEGSR